MGTPATTFTLLTPDQFAKRMAQLFPPGWSSPDAKQPGGVLYGVMTALGAGLSDEMLAAEYAFDATLIGTSINDAVDGHSADYFGTTGLYALPRQPGETDASYIARIEAALLPGGATRSAVSNAIEAVTGVVPRLVEPWRPLDTGVIDGGPGEGMMFYDVDNATTPGQMTDTSLNYQGFVQTILPLAEPFGNNPTPCVDEYTFNYDVAGSSLLDNVGSSPLGAQEVYNAINRAKCEGTIVWVQFVAPLGVVYWDESGVHWDQSGINWQ